MKQFTFKCNQCKKETNAILQDGELCCDSPEIRVIPTFKKNYINKDIFKKAEVIKAYSKEDVFERLRRLNDILPK